MKKTSSGPANGVGAAIEWQGNSKAGAGKMEITDSVPSSLILMRLNKLKPFEASNLVKFSFVPEGSVTKVSWEMSGTANFISKLFGVLIDCENMVGAQFEEGLSNLKALVEANK